VLEEREVFRDDCGGLGERTGTIEMLCLGENISLMGYWEEEKEGRGGGR
jgi:hypothetical protein